MAQHRYRPVSGPGIYGKNCNAIPEAYAIISGLQKKFAKLLESGKLKIGVGPAIPGHRRAKPTFQPNGRSLHVKVKGATGGQILLVTSDNDLWSQVEVAIKGIWRRNY